jgi:isopentenyl diphosphate isomerase/L-lactate dehydrogenase-like FMN-dependent dehydrogenase
VQIFPWKDRGVTASFVRRAERLGYKGVVLTIDNNVPGKRLADLRNGLQIPPRVTPSIVIDGLMHLSWTLRMGPMRLLDPSRLTAILYQGAGAGAPEEPAELTGYMLTQLNARADWDELRYVRSIYKATHSAA